MKLDWGDAVVAIEMLNIAGNLARVLVCMRRLAENFQSGQMFAAYDLIEKYYP
jgi:hypothetical protein